jgi:SAM-dependent methyltransferase
MNRKERRAANKTAPSRLPHTDAAVSVAELAARASALHAAGRLDETRAICRQILGREPAHVQALNLLGLAAQRLGDHRAAVKMFGKAIAADQLNAACHYNAGNSFERLGERARARGHFSTALALGMGERAPALILQSPLMSAYAGRIASRWPLLPTTTELFGADGVRQLAADVFLLCAIESEPLTDIRLEAILRCARHALLQIAAQPEQGGDVDSDLLAFACALARQCFINEYIYQQGEEEAALAAALRDRLVQQLGSEHGVAPLTLVVVAAYFPLQAVADADALLTGDWPPAVDALLQVQVREPLEERRNRAAIPSLTPIRDSVSQEVQQQYEQNPYPRWTANPLAAIAGGEAPARAQADQPIDILIAGCGTGLHAVQTAQVNPKARLLAIDISLTSLAYARRKTRELGLRNIDFAQADILELGALGRSFDSIESVGVLHHLAAPAMGWRVLVSLLRSGGRMRIGLYSEAARRLIVEARADIAARGYRATSDDIRRFRQDVLSHPQRWRDLIAAPDFYSMSGCRDLLFNVMEHRFTIPQIAEFLTGQGLVFTGFDPFEDPAVTERFRAQFAGAADETDLEQWHRFETAYPDTFRGMYVFTAEKPA